MHHLCYIAFAQANNKLNLRSIQTPSKSFQIPIAFLNGNTVVERGCQLARASGLIAEPSDVTPQAVEIMTSLYEGNTSGCLSLQKIKNANSNLMTELLLFLHF